MKYYLHVFCDEVDVSNPSKHTKKIYSKYFLQKLNIIIVMCHYPSVQTLAVLVTSQVGEVEGELLFALPKTVAAAGAAQYILPQLVLAQHRY